MSVNAKVLDCVVMKEVVVVGGGSAVVVVVWQNNKGKPDLTLLIQIIAW